MHSSKIARLVFSRDENISRGILIAAVASALFQLYWFGRNGAHQINYDGMDYLGIARHIIHHDFHSAINGFRSPLISWLVAAWPASDNNLLLIGKLLSACSFLVLMASVYLFTNSLWRSKLVASLAAFWLTLCRGMSAFAVNSVSPDLLFAGLTVVYFWVLLRCLRDDRAKFWFLLGIVHGVAFLCKAIALPWLSVTTLLALFLWRERGVKSLSTRFVAAMLVPVLAGTAWAAVLHSKYGKFTIGTQFKTNLLQWTLREYRGRRDPSYAVLINQAPMTDSFMVTDPMAPGSWPWRYKVDWVYALPKIIASEALYVPQAVKEILILITPGGVVALLLIGIMTVRRRKEWLAESRITFLIAASTVTLILAYCMLVFDDRYVYPLIPLFLAISSRALVAGSDPRVPLELSVSWRATVITLLAAGLLFSLLYAASPFRNLRQDYQASCYDAAAKLSAHPGKTIITLGSGPYPEHGVGWEAGFKSAFFANRRLIARMNDLPNSESLQFALSDIAKAKSDAVLVWGDEHDVRYVRLLATFREQYPNSTLETIYDPHHGEVGKVVFLRAE